MATPAYSGGGFHRRGWGSRRWAHAPGPTGNGWLDRVGALFDGTNTPRYAGTGQPVPGALGRQVPEYLAPPAATAATVAPITAPQTATSVIVAGQT